MDLVSALDSALAPCRVGLDGHLASSGPSLLSPDCAVGEGAMEAARTNLLASGLGETATVQALTALERVCLPALRGETRTIPNTPVGVRGWLVPDWNSARRELAACLDSYVDRPTENANRTFWLRFLFSATLVALVLAFLLVLIGLADGETSPVEVRPTTREIRSSPRPQTGTGEVRSRPRIVVREARPQPQTVVGELPPAVRRRVQTAYRSPPPEPVPLSVPSPPPGAIQTVTLNEAVGGLAA